VIWVAGFGEVSRREYEEAEAFYAELLGRRRARVPHEDAPFEQAPSPLPPQFGGLRQVCGFIGPNAVVRTETEVRTAVVAAANAESTAWASGAGRRLENDPTMFGRLVTYRLAAISNARPDTLTAMWATALGAINYGTLATGTSSLAERRRVRGLLTAGAPGTTTPANLDAQIESALQGAVDSHNDHPTRGPWSSVWVSRVVRGAGITLGIEAFSSGVHGGRDLLLRATARHAEYAREAHDRTVARRGGTYHAFDPATRAPQLGDIIVQDRSPADPARSLTFASLATLVRRPLHGDIVVEVDAGHVVALGGNVDNSCRRRRYPRDAAGNLVVDIDRAYSQETDAGVLPPVPAAGRPPATNAAARAEHDRHCTRRIFALLSPVQTCIVPPGQTLPGGGVLV
jgi:hypothetical protein